MHTLGTPPPRARFEDALGARGSRHRLHPPAKVAADGKDVRLGGGVSNVRAFLDADLVDTMHVAVAPIELGRGGKLWDSPDELLDRFHLERIPSSSGVTHHLFWRR